MGESSEELMAKRDELIEQLQGEWAIDKDIKSTNRKAIRLGGLIIVAGMALIIVIFPGMYFVASGEERANVLDGAGEFGLIMFALMAFFGGLVFVGTHAQAWWHRKLNPIVVDGHRLVWNKKKGFVPERVSLLGLEQVVTPGGDDVVFAPLESGFKMLLEKMMGSSGGAFGTCILGSPGEHNTPKISSAMFIEGERLIRLLFEVAAINTKLNEFEEADEPKA